MMKYWILLLILGLIPFAASEINILSSDGTTDDVVNIVTPDPPINYSLIPTVNSSDFWDSLDTPLDITGNEFWYNQTLAAYNLWNAVWLSTYNFTYHTWAYNQTLAGDDRFLKLDASNDPITSSLEVTSTIQATISSDISVPAIPTGTCFIARNNLNADDDSFITLISGSAGEMGHSYGSGMNTTSFVYDDADNTFKWQVETQNIMELNENTLTVLDSGVAASGLVAPKGTFGRVVVDTLNLNNNEITDSTGEISFVDEDLTTTGTVQAEQLTSTDDATVADRLYVGDEKIFLQDSGTNLVIRSIEGTVGGLTVRNSDSPILTLQNDVCARNLAQLFVGQCSRFSVAQSANINYTYFELAADGEIPVLEVYGHPTGLDRKYGRFQVANVGGVEVFQITSDSGVIDFDNENLNTSGNITASNVFLPQYMFAHTNATISVLGVGIWTNISFAQEDSDIKIGISHIYNDATNHTFMIMEDGVYEFDYDLDIEDVSAGASDVDVAARLSFVNGTEVVGSVFETDITKNGVGAELSHDFLVECKAGDEFMVQFTGSDSDVVISTHGTFGDYPESASIVMNKIANL